MTQLKNGMISVTPNTTGSSEMNFSEYFGTKLLSALEKHIILSGDNSVDAIAKRSTPKYTDAK